MKKGLLLLCLLGVVVLSACSSKDTIYRAPDETKVQKQKSLILPPDYELRPPKTLEK